MDVKDCGMGRGRSRSDDGLVVLLFFFSSICVSCVCLDCWLYSMNRIRYRAFAEEFFNIKHLRRQVR